MTTLKNKENLDPTSLEKKQNEYVSPETGSTETLAKMNDFTVTKTTAFGIQRKMVSYMTTQSWQNIPHVTYVYEPDITDFMSEYSKLSEKDGTKISFNTLMLRAIVEGLKAAPALNAHIEYNKKYVTGRIDLIKDINVSLPWILPNGEMMTINMRNFEDKNLAEMTGYIRNTQRKIENTDFTQALYEMSFHDTMQNLKKGRILQTVRKLLGAKIGSSKVRTLSGNKKKEYEKIPVEDRLTKLDLEPGTVTISNFGSIYKEQRGFAGILEIIPPQVCAIAVGGVQEKASVFINEKNEKEIGIRKILPLSIAFDHRALDFGEVVPFMKQLDAIFENPEIIHTW